MNATITREPVAPSALSRRERFFAARTDRTVRNDLVEENLGLVHSIARSYRGGSLPHEDLVQEGTIGLMKAVEKFDPDRGVVFGTYAYHWVKAPILRALKQKGREIRLPMNVVDRAQGVRRSREILTRELGREPSDGEVAGRLGWTLREVEEVFCLPFASSLNTLEGFEPVEYEEDAEDFAHLVPALEGALNGLPERLRGIVEDRYGLGGRDSKSLRQIGEEQGCSAARIAILQKKAEEILRESMGSRSGVAR